MSSRLPSCLFIAAGLAATAISPAVAQAPMHRTSAQRECFEEGNGIRHCADLSLNCEPSDFACLADDLTGAILRSAGDPSIRYAAYLARGIAARNANQISDAIDDFEAAQAIQPRLATPLILLGQVHADLGRMSRALASFDEANRRAPGLPVILANRADVRLKTGNPDGAIADLTQAITVMRSGKPIPDGSDEAVEALLVSRGYAWMDKREPEKAREDFKAAVAANPRYAPALAALKSLGVN